MTAERPRHEQNSDHHHHLTPSLRGLLPVSDDLEGHVKKRVDRMQSALLWIHTAAVFMDKAKDQIGNDDPCMARMAVVDAIGKLNQASKELLSCYRKVKR